MQRGFSLVELSIVLVILGLLTGGILAGQSLIRASELRSLTTESQRFLTATQTFRDKYFAIPGDMTNATKFWGIQGDATACKTTPSTTALTCDGNGDGNLSTTDGGTTYYEIFRYWQQLANAGLLEGSYTGVTGSGAVIHDVPGSNVPRSRMNNMAWGVTYSGPTYTGSTAGFALDFGNFYYAGAPMTNGTVIGKSLKPEELWNIDTKLDDGKPANGKIISYWWDECTDATSNSNLTANYALNNSTADCAIIVRKSLYN